MDQFLIGTYQLGYRWVDVYAQPDNRGGEFYFIPDDLPANARIKVGFAYNNIDEPWAVLVHEVCEATLSEMFCRYIPTYHLVQCASDMYLFKFDHNQFTEFAARIAYLLWNIRKDFESAFELIKEAKK
jgi:hypothetical protein